MNDHQQNSDRDNFQSDTAQDQNETQMQTPAEPTAGEPESGFVGSAGDQSGDYLTKSENEEFESEEMTTDIDAGTSDIETGQPTSPDATLDDGSDTSR